jgi:N-acetylglucosaminyl-diphospho-decaprenol L-rhamnosyltransferase
VEVLAIIVNYRTPELTLRALEACVRELKELPGSRVCLVDNGSGDGSLEQLRAFVAERGWDDRVTLVASARNEGFAHGVNTAMRAAEARELPGGIYLLNSDAWPDPGAIKALVSFLEEHPEVGIAGSYIHGPEGETHDTAFRFPGLASHFEQAAGIGLVSRLLRRWIVSPPVPTVACQVDWLAGASMLIRRQVFESIGPFDENFFLYYEETDFCLRAARASWPTWYVPASSVEHVGAASTGWKDLSRPRAASWFEGRRYYLAKHHGRLYLWAANWLWVMGYLIWRVRAWIGRKPYRYPPRFFRDFLRHNFGFRPISKPPEG